MLVIIFKWKPVYKPLNKSVDNHYATTTMESKFFFGVTYFYKLHQFNFMLGSGYWDSIILTRRAAGLLKYFDIFFYVFYHISLSSLCWQTSLSFIYPNIRKQQQSLFLQFDKSILDCSGIFWFFVFNKCGRLFSICYSSLMLLLHLSNYLTESRKLDWIRYWYLMINKYVIWNIFIFVQCESGPS